MKMIVTIDWTDLFILILIPLCIIFLFLDAIFYLIKDEIIERRNKKKIKQALNNKFGIASKDTNQNVCYTDTDRVWTLKDEREEQNEQDNCNT